MRRNNDLGSRESGGGGKRRPAKSIFPKESIGSERVVDSYFRVSTRVFMLNGENRPGTFPAEAGRIHVPGL